MSTAKHYETLQEDQISLVQKMAYGLGMMCNNLIPAALGCMAVVLNLGLKMNPAAIGYIMSFPRLVDAFTDPAMGFVSDKTRSTYGRRRPYIFVGALISGFIFALMWQDEPRNILLNMVGMEEQSFFYWFFLAGCICLFVGTTIFATPFVALGYEMTPDYHERTRVMAWANWFGQIPWILCPWFWWIMTNKNYFATEVEGAKTIALIVGLTVMVFGVMPAIFCKERFKPSAKEPPTSFKEKAKDTVKGLKTVKNALVIKPFFKLCAATLLLFNGYNLVAGLGIYVLIYYTFGGDPVLGGKYNGLFGTTTALSTVFLVIPFVTRLSTKFGKKQAFIISTSISVIGFLLKWWCFNPENLDLLMIKKIELGPFSMERTSLIPLIPAVFISFGIGGLFTTVGSMMADTCDLDELSSGKRREGIFGAIYWWTVKLGMTIAFALSGHILNFTGFDVALEKAQSTHTLFLLRLFDVYVPILTSLLAILMVYLYNINEERARNIRVRIERRREDSGPLPATS